MPANVLLPSREMVAVAGRCIACGRRIADVTRWSNMGPTCFAKFAQVVRRVRVAMVRPAASSEDDDVAQLSLEWSADSELSKSPEVDSPAD